MNEPREPTEESIIEQGRAYADRFVEMYGPALALALLAATCTKLLWRISGQNPVRYLYLAAGLGKRLTDAPPWRMPPTKQPPTTGAPG